jgi:hypothetical protein
MATQVGLTIVKRFTYRGNQEEFANEYHLTGAVPADNAAWKALTDALIVAEKTCYTAGVSVVRAYGYDSDDPHAHAVWTYDYLANTASVPGTLTSTSAVIASGDQAAWVRWKTSRLNSKGKVIYLRKYFHGGTIGTGTPDYITTAWATALAGLGTKLRDGTFLDARTITARGHTDVIVGSTAATFITTRTLKRRGKRPTSP